MATSPRVSPLIDLHTHSDRSDGTVGPGELVALAARAGLDVVALTDHDTAAGWSEAADAARRVGIELVPGMEISCRYDGAGVHLLGYLPDPSYPPLAAELQRVLEGRQGRLPVILARLNDLGIEIEESDVVAVAGEAAATGRPHVADALVAKGVVASRDEAFDRFLGAGGPAYVDRYAADLPTMVDLVRRAGGVSVVAHPWATRRSCVLDIEALAAMKEVGLTGVEVDHEDHDPDTRARLRQVAAELDLVITGSSDFHGAGKTGHDLACNTTAPEQLERLLEGARVAAHASGRRVPEVVR